MSSTAADESVLHGGFRLLWFSVHAQPRPFILSIIGATLFAVMAVGGTIVLGRVVDDVLTPAFEEGGVGRDAVALGAIAIVAASLLRMVGGGAAPLLRADGPAAHAGAVVPPRDRPLPHGAAALVRRAPDRASSSPTPTPTASGRRWRCNPSRSRCGVVVIIVVAMVQLALVDPVLLARRPSGCSPAWPC